MTLTGRLVVVTGAGRGLGLAIAHDLAAAGAHLVIAERNPGFAAAAAAELAEHGVPVHRVDTDVSDPDSVQRLADRVAALGGAYGVVNNAALADGVGGKHFYDIEPDEFDRIMSVNLRGTWLVSKALYPQLRAKGDGRILNIASDVAFYGPPRLMHYVASKGAIVAMTRAMARDAGPDGITVNAVAPGITECEATQAVPAERHELYRINRALARPQQPEDLVGAVRFLLSDAAAYITGQTLLVDGGFVCR
ncbi:3-oxoacyl-ACP reductase family protein [Saccharopolyspora elongata]|uniref:3-oxoacyl-ACP reductase FabG n=1 Tax=Saccharopolyspora elongata TaxID=2530387 RepID=A0A4R4YYY0_9PSEU|nr:3-oxoacyl-ACP reductase family protein [Saccharopolyspora elongata]TDD50755.1 3-oxoacyl-ACP reductase FabG [Saccharopolyspora elongata]